MHAFIQVFYCGDACFELDQKVHSVSCAILQRLATKAFKRLGPEVVVTLTVIVKIWILRLFPAFSCTPWVVRFVCVFACN
jgi:hypothetical protein